MSQLFSNEPAGLDLSEGQAHRAVANQIVAQIVKPDRLCTVRGANSLKEVTVIGLDGAWGSGKSNVVRMVRDGLSKDGNSGKYVFFEYNVWGHQQDPIRKSILRSLVEHLIEQQGFDRSVWEEKAQQMLGRKITHFHVDVRCVSPWILLTALSVLFYPAFRALAGLCSDWGKVFYLSVPFLLGGIGYVFAFCRCYKADRGGGWMRVQIALRAALFDLFGFLRDSNFIGKRTTIVDEREAGADELMRFVRDVVANLEGKRLVMVFDDLDRLPQEKLREFWATLHTLFVDKVLKMRIGKLSVLVPFDRTRVLKALSEQGDEARDADVLGKTFDSIYRISPLMAEDWRKLYMCILRTAFPDLSTEDQTEVWQLFDELVPEGERTPRALLATMNATKQAYEGCAAGVPRYYCHLFVLCRDAIFERGAPAGNIMTFGFVPKLAGMLARHLQTHEDDAKRYLSALAFQVDVDRSNAVLHEKAAVEAFESGDAEKIAVLSKEPDWIPVCDKAILSARRLDAAVAALCGMDDAGIPGEISSACWKSLYVNRGKELVDLTRPGPEMAAHEKSLVAHLPDRRQEYAVAVLQNARRQMELSPLQFCGRLHGFEDAMARYGVSIAGKLDEWRLPAERYLELARGRREDLSFCRATVDKDEVEVTFLQRLSRGEDFWTDLEVLLECWDADAFRGMNPLKMALANARSLRDDARGIPVVFRFLDEAFGPGWIQTRFTPEALKTALRDGRMDMDCRLALMAALCQSNLRDLSTGNPDVDALWQSNELTLAEQFARCLERFADVKSITINARFCEVQPPLVMAALRKIWIGQGLYEKLDAAFCYADPQVVVPLAKKLNVVAADG